ncbi:aldehyde dehydrogenase [Lactococcus nasutitermitis]|uniref:Aldehyde dehydrogenase n=1 Tax=Lactococcus nasutitermitis TaxID=1652957 RepID=A0ABV9JCX1_9LACT|nr:aldehyde dehydrogenase [Lactococcus nasutitermitis]
MNDFSDILLKQREFFASGRTRELDFRLKNLTELSKWIVAHDGEILTALKIDLNKAAFESYATEVGVVLDELRLTKKSLTAWSKVKRVPANLKNFPAYGKIYPEPYGVALIMAPWNYPFQLLIDPLIAAIAAGNCVIVKPAEEAPATSHLIAKMCAEIFSDSFVSCVEGDKTVAEALLQLHFDKIFFTGSPAVGKIVMRSASEFLTPVTLELGGKSPCIIDETANLKLAARRIAWGKFLNAGQTCVAPDYLLIDEKIKKIFLTELSKTLMDFYGNALTNNDYPKIINERHFARLVALMTNEQIFLGGQTDELSRKIAPTILDNVSWDAPVMQEEIFGPLLPILTYKQKEEVIEQINSRPKPLACYIFTENKKNEQYFLKNLSFGGGCVNDTVVHVSVSSLPFGGVGNSGMGAYHGKAGFDCFTHYKSVLYKSKRVDIPLRYPPYKEKWLRLLKKL